MPAKGVNLEYVLKKAYKDLDHLDPKLLQKLAYHQFSFIRRFHSSLTYPVLSIRFFGSFVIRRNRFYQTLINRVIPAVRKFPESEYYREVLAKCLAFRHNLNLYYSIVKYKRVYRDGGGFKKIRTKIGDIRPFGQVDGESTA